MKTFLRSLFFNLSYLGNPPWDSGISPPELLEFIAEHPPGRALDLGCGTGTNVLTLVQAGWQVTGIDYAVLAIRAARRRLRQAGLKADLRAGDATVLRGIQGPFDLMLDIGCFHGLTTDGQARYLRNLLRHLAPGGTFLLYAHRLHPQERDGHGLDEQTIEQIQEHFTLVKRVDSFDRGGPRPSSWLSFCKPVNGGLVR